MRRHLLDEATQPVEHETRVMRDLVPVHERRTRADVAATTNVADVRQTPALMLDRVAAAEQGLRPLHARLPQVRRELRVLRRKSEQARVERRRLLEQEADIHIEFQSQSLHARFQGSCRCVQERIDFIAQIVIDVLVHVDGVTLHARNFARLHPLRVASPQRRDLPRPCPCIKELCRHGLIRFVEPVALDAFGQCGIAHLEHTQKQARHER